MHMVLFFLLNFLALAPAFLCAQKLIRRADYSEGIEAAIDLLPAVFVLYLSQIIIVELILGIAGRLNLANLIIINLVICIFAVLFYRAGRSAPVLPAPGKAVGKLITDPVLRIFFCVIISFGLVKVLVNLFNPPFGWDSLNYHFTFPVEWLKHANLNNPITINDDFAPTYYPVNGSLFYFWLIVPLRSVFLADLGQLPFFALAFFSLFGVGRKLRLNNEMSFLGAALFVLIPNFFKQLQIAYVDVMVAALFFFCLNSLLLLEKRFSPINVLFFGAGLGLLLGMKLIALPYGTLLLVPFIYLWMKKARFNRAQALIIALAAVLALGGFSYVRNWFETGNPFYPLNIRLMGKDLFPGVIERASYAAHFKLSDYRLGKLLFHEGLGVQTLIFVLPAAFLAFPAALLKKRRETGFVNLYFLALPVLLWLVFRYVIPLANTRYLYPLLGVGMISAFYTAGSLKIPRFLLRSAAVVCVLASISELAKRQELVSSILLTIAVYFLLPLLFKYLKWPKPEKNPVIILICLVAAFLFLEGAQAYYLKNEFRRYNLMRKYSGFWPEAATAWEWLNNNTSGNNIAYVGRPVPFPLYGSNFKNNVYYVSVNRTEPAKLQYFPGSFYRWDDDFSHMQKDFEAAGNYRSGEDYSVWLANLRSRKTDYLFIYSLHQTKDLEFPIEETWARANPEVFRPVFGNQTIKIYRAR